jgi:hypothetical protein
MKRFRKIGIELGIEAEYLNLKERKKKKRNEKIQIFTLAALFWACLCTLNFMQK